MERAGFRGNHQGSANSKVDRRKACETRAERADPLPSVAGLGLYHATNEGGYISWADLAEEAYQAAGMNVRVDRVTTAEYGLSVAARPYNSRLDKSKLVENGFKPLPDWKDAVARYIKEAEL